MTSVSFKVLKCGGETTEGQSGEELGWGKDGEVNVKRMGKQR
jgi:hypothetical protein